MYGFLVFAATEGGGHAGNGFLTGDLGDKHTLYEVLISAAASIIVFALLYWKGMPAAKKGLAARTARIAKELDDATKARNDSEGRLGDVQQRIANAEDERQRILVEARQTAEALKTQIVERAADEAIADLQAEVGALAMGAAEAVIARNLDPVTQTQLIDGYINQVGAQQ